MNQNRKILTELNWTEKGATFSDKSARKEYGLTHEEIIEAINNGKLQYQNNHIHGNPYFRLFRKEVEVLVKEKYGEDYLKNKSLKNELDQLNRDLRKLKKEISALEKRKSELLKSIGK